MIFFQNVVDTVALTRSRSGRFLDRMTENYGQALDPTLEPAMGRYYYDETALNEAQLLGGAASSAGAAGQPHRLDPELGIASDMPLRVPDRRPGADNAGSGASSPRAAALASGAGSSGLASFFLPSMGAAAWQGLVPPLPIPVSRSRHRRTRSAGSTTSARQAECSTRTRSGDSAASSGGEEPAQAGEASAGALAPTSDVHQRRPAELAAPASQEHAGFVDDVANAVLGTGEGGEGLSDMTTLSLRSWVESSMPFLLILLGAFVYHRRTGIAQGLWLGTVFYFANLHVKVSVARRELRSRLSLAAVAVVVLAHVLAVQWLYRVELGSVLWLAPPPEALPLFSVCWVVLLNDFCVRLAAVGTKALLLILWTNNQALKRRGHWLAELELLFTLYRQVLPLPLWYSFFSSDTYGYRLSIVLTLLYVAFKLYMLVEYVTGLVDISAAVLRGELMFGRYVSASDAEKIGGICSICQDHFTDAVQLACLHVFCEDCISVWLHNCKTCPICRTAVAATVSSFGCTDGSTSMLPVLF